MVECNVRNHLLSSKQFGYPSRWTSLPRRGMEGPVLRRACWWWREPLCTHLHRRVPRRAPAPARRSLAVPRSAGRRKRPRPAPTLRAPPPPPQPFLPDRIGKRPRRERPPAVPLVPADKARMCAHRSSEARVPPTGTPGLSPKRGRLELLGQRYGPRNTCSVDTMLTLAQARRTATHPSTRPSTHPPKPCLHAA